MARYSTPLRYPGGKQKLSPFIAEIISANDLIGGQYVEPYAGGAGVAIQLLLKGLVSKIHLNDSSKPVYAFWRAVLAHTDELCRLIASASLTVDEWKRRREIVRNPGQHSILELGFSTFYLNRCNRSGVLSGGLIGGLDQKGEWKLDARFSRNELVRRIEAIASLRTRISIRNMDAEAFIAHIVPDMPKETLVYCDPPYFAKSSRLYLDSYSAEDHKRLSRVIQSQLHRKWVVSYDSAPEILAYYQRRRHFLYDLQYNASRVYRGSEVFVFSDDLNLPQNSSIPSIDAALRMAA
jgi:DNA adenine methylase